jgi:hypothetical protein
VDAQLVLDADRAGVAAPRLPVFLDLELGARNSEMPFTPGRARRAVRARTRWTMLSVASWSPQVMKIFWPFRA